MIRWEEARTVLGQLEAVAAKLGVEVRFEALGQDGDAAPTRGGLCRVKGEDVIYVDSRLSPPDMCRVLAEALSHFDLSDMFMPPAVRRLVERASAVEPED
ncbi:MAG: hypothetical protein PHU25_10565 [Deltaproteobacteria bacterium]|nr:hypothetical protein [Deltaproteobacteria bacterium]